MSCRVNSGIRIASLGYHEVTDTPNDSGFQRPLALSYKHSRSAFLKHLEIIESATLRPELITDIDLGKSGTHLALTFDDGGKSALHISDELSRRGWRGHFLITSGLIGTRTFMSRQDICELRRAGHLVGSHSHTHPDIFRRQTLEGMVAEWTRSRDILSQLLGEPCIVGSVPGGDISRRVFQSAAASELRYLFTSEPWLKPRKVGLCWILGRAIIKAGTPIEQIEAYVGLRGWARALIKRRTSVLARWLLRPLYYEYVRNGIKSRAKPPDGSMHPSQFGAP